MTCDRIIHVLTGFCSVKIEKDSFPILSKSKSVIPSVSIQVTYLIDLKANRSRSIIIPFITQNQHCHLYATLVPLATKRVVGNVLLEFSLNGDAFQRFYRITRKQNKI